MKDKTRGYDTSRLFREDTLTRIRRLESEANGIFREMNRIIDEGDLPEKPVPVPFPEDDPVYE